MIFSRSSATLIKDLTERSLLTIGLTGTFAAGKDTVAEHLQTKGFEHYSTGDQIREIAEERGIEQSRDTLRELGNELRDKYGSEYLCRRIIEEKAKTDKIVISGIRQPGEIKYLKALGNFHLIAVDAPVEVRFERMKKRNRTGDPQSLEEMVEKERQEMESAGPNAQRIHECMQMADSLVINDGDINKLDKEIDEILSKFEG